MKIDQAGPADSLVEAAKFPKYRAGGEHPEPMALRIVYRPPRLLRLAIAATLAAWVILFAYLVAYTDPPFVVVLLLFLPVLALALTFWLTNRAVAWEIDPISFRKRIDDRVSSGIAISDIGSLVVVSSPDASFAHLRVLDRLGKEQQRVVPGPALNIQNLRAIYESLAFYLEPHGIKGRNPFGWKAQAPSGEEVRAEGQRERILPHFSTSLIVAGLLITATGTYAGRPVSIQYGVGITSLGLIVLGIGLLVRRRRKLRSGNTS